MLPKKLNALVSEYLTHEDELRADLQETYGIDLDRAMGGEHTARHIAALVVQLPSNARVRVSEDKDAMWTLENVINVSILNSIRMWMWGISDPKKRGSQPEIIGASWMKKANTRSLPSRVLSVDKLLEELNKPRR